MTIPSAPTLPDPHPSIVIPPYYTVEEVLTYGKDWLKHSEALMGEINRLRNLPNATTQRFPGDPGPGKAVFGVAPGQDSRVNLSALEREVGGPLAFRQYHGGSADFLVPTGILAKAIVRDHREGRIPVISPKPGIERLAEHDPQLEKRMVPFFKWLDDQPGITYLIIEHESENNWKSDFGNLEKYKEHQNASRLAQRWVRALITKAVGPNPKKIVFIGSLLSYSWSAEGKRKFGDPEGWNPGKREDGRHIWDVACLDHYLPSYTGTTLENAQFRAAVKSIENWGCLLGITENGVNRGNRNGGKVLVAFIKRLIEDHGCVIYLYFSSSAGPGGKPQPNPNDHWTLIPENGSLPAFVDAYRNYNSNPNGA